MTDKNYKTLRDLGFWAQGTGGGCAGWRLQARELHLFITDGEAGMPELTGQLFLMSDKHGEPIMQSKLMDMDELTNMLRRLL